MEIKMTIIYEKADGLIQASVAELPGAIALGADVEEARRNLDEAIEMVWKETACSPKMLSHPATGVRSRDVANNCGQ